MTYGETCKMAKVLNLPIDRFLFSKTYGMIGNDTPKLKVLASNDLALGIEVPTNKNKWEQEHIMQSYLLDYDVPERPLLKASFHRFSIEIDKNIKSFFIIESTPEFWNLYDYKPRIIAKR